MFMHSQSDTISSLHNFRHNTQKKKEIQKRKRVFLDHVLRANRTTTWMQVKLYNDVLCGDDEDDWSNFTLQIKVIIAMEYTQICCCVGFISFGSIQKM